MKRKISQIAETSQQNRSAMTSAITCISLFHDNPQLTKTVAESESMEVLLETALSKTKVKMVFGKIIFSGPFDPSSVGVHVSQVRGGDVIIAEVLELITADLSKFPNRFVDEIKLLQLRGSSDNTDIDRIPGSDVDEAVLEEFFSTCPSRVDVILDPIRQDDGFYPYFEGTRKLAPQFRSKGIGYIRLGDDMSNFGSAFLSADGGRTFLDRGKNDANVLSNSIAGALRSAKKARKSVSIAPSALPEPSKPEVGKVGRPTVTTRLAAKRAAEAAAARAAAAASYASPKTAPMSAAKKMKLTESLRRLVSAQRSSKDDADLDEIADSSVSVKRQLMPSSPISVSKGSKPTLGATLQSLLDSLVGETVWKTKVDLLNRLKDSVDSSTHSELDELLSEESVALRVLETLRDLLSSTQNPQVTIAALTVLQTSFFVLAANIDHIPLSAARKALLVEALQLLRHSNRQIEVAATRTLTGLFTPSQTSASANHSVAVWGHLCESLEVALGLSVASSSSSSASKNVAKLNKLLDWVTASLQTSFPVSASTESELSTHLQEVLLRLVPIAAAGLRDRDEKTRASGLQMAAWLTVLRKQTGNGDEENNTSTWATTLETAGISQSKLAPVLAKLISSSS